MYFNKNNKILFGVLIGLLFVRINVAQSKTNFEVIKLLVDKSAGKISQKIDADKISLEFIAPPEYSVLRAELISELQKQNIVLFDSVKSNLPELNYTINKASIIYKELFKDGILGTYLIKREAHLDGSYFLKQKNQIGKVNDFSFTTLDTVLYDDIKNLENIGYNFTSAELPEEPFFSSLLEPAIAIGTAAVAVYLFFNIRSK